MLVASRSADDVSIARSGGRPLIIENHVVNGEGRITLLRRGGFFLRAPGSVAGALNAIVADGDPSLAYP